MTDKKVELQEENLDNVNGGNAIETLGKVAKVGSKVINAFTGKGEDAKPAAPTNKQNVSNNEAKKNQRTCEK